MLVIISERTARFQKLAVRLNSLGIYLFNCCFEAAPYYCAHYDTGGVLLDCVGNMPAAKKLCLSLHERYPDMPIAVTVEEHARPNLPVTNVYRDNGDDTALFFHVLDFSVTVCGFGIQPLSTYWLKVENDCKKTIYMGYPMPLSPREHNILRCLFYMAPKPCTREMLLELCYPDSIRRAQNINVMISRINRRASAINPTPLIVTVSQNVFRLRDGIL